MHEQTRAPFPTRVVVTDQNGQVLSCSPDLPQFLARSDQPSPHLLAELLASLPSFIVHQALPLNDGTLAHTLTRLPPEHVQLQHDNRMLRETLDAIDGPVVVYSNDLIYVFGNAAYHAFYRHLPAEAELIGKPYDHVLGLSLAAGATTDPQARADPAAFIAERRTAMLQRVNSTQEIHSSRLGRWTTVRTTWTESGNRVSLRVDITALKRLQQELLDTQRMKTIGHISGGVAHNFNNLLTVIISNIEMVLENDDLGEDSARLVRRALSGAEAGARLVLQLLTFARRDVTEAQTIDPVLVLTDMAELLRGAAGASIPIEIVPASEVSMIRVDPAQFATALMNLVLNARDAVQSGLRERTTRRGRIRISIATTPESLVAITVSDNGCGMPPEVVVAAFDPFFTTKGPAAASGLGLSQVHGFALGAGGDVRIQSVLGSGTSVEIELPAAPATGAT